METNGTRDTTWVIQFAQDHLPDVVTHAARCKPNAPGRSPWSSVDAFEQRQLLKAAGCFRSEHLIVALTPIHVCVLSTTSRGRLIGVERWDRTRAQVARISRRGADPTLGPAFRIGNPRHFEAVELIPIDGFGAELLTTLADDPVPTPGRSPR